MVLRPADPRVVNTATITAPHATAEIEIGRYDFISRAGEPMGWMAAGLTFAQVRDYCSQRGWVLRLADEAEQEAMASDEG